MKNYETWTREELILELMKRDVAKKNHRGAGRKPILNPHMYTMIKKRNEKGMNYKQIADEVGISVGTVCKAMKKLRFEEKYNVPPELRCTADKQ